MTQALTTMLTHALTQVGQRLTIADLDSIDYQVKNVLSQMRRLAEMGDEMLESVELQWSTRLTDGAWKAGSGLLSA